MCANVCYPNEMKAKLLLFIALIIGFSVYRVYFSDTDKKEITKIINDLEKSLEYKKTLTPLAAISRLERIKSHLSADFSAKSIGDDQERVVSDIDKLKEGAISAAGYFSNIDIFKLPYLITINETRASTSFKATISGQDKQGEKFKELFNVVPEFIKIKNKWYCSSITVERLTPDEEEHSLDPTAHRIR